MSFMDTVDKMEAKGFGFNLLIQPDNRIEVSFYQWKLKNSMAVIKGRKDDLDNHVAEAAKAALNILGKG